MLVRVYIDVDCGAIASYYIPCVYLFSRVISRITILIAHIRGLISLLITTHEPIVPKPSSWLQ